MSKEDNPPSETMQESAELIALPDHMARSGSLDRLVETARNYAHSAASKNTLKAYKADWAPFARWCRLHGSEPLPPSAEMVGLYLADLANP